MNMEVKIISYFEIYFEIHFVLITFENTQKEMLLVIVEINLI